MLQRCIILIHDIAIYDNNTRADIVTNSLFKTSFFTKYVYIFGI